MEKDWIELKSFSKKYNSAMVKEILKDNEIDSVVINQKGSMLQIGTIELYVHKDNEEKAKQILKEIEENK